MSCSATLAAQSTTDEEWELLQTERRQMLLQREGKADGDEPEPDAEEVGSP